MFIKLGGTAKVQNVFRPLWTMGVFYMEKDFFSEWKEETVMPSYNLLLM